MRTLRWGHWVVVAALAAVGIVAPPPAATEAAVDDIVAIVIEGTGFGHGRGMSQWGAYGWAVDEGKTWQWILDHYYGGTTLSDVATAQTRIRVRLNALDDMSTVGVTSNSGNVTAAGQTWKSIYAREVSSNLFQLYGSNSTACPSALTVPDGRDAIAKGSSNGTAVRQIQTFLNAYRITGDGTLTVDGDFGNLTEARLKDWQSDQGLISSGIWDDNTAARARSLIGSSTGAVTWEPLGSAVVGPITFTNTNSENSAAAPTDVLGVCDSSGRVTHYRGEIEVHNAPSDNNANRVVNDVKTEDYLRGVVSKEISASWADAGGGRGGQAVRAQAVAARSYGLQQNRYTYATICDTQSCQVYGGAATRPSATGSAKLVEDARTDAAIFATAGKVRTWPNGSIVATEFSASNGPRTAGGAFPPVDDSDGDDTPRNPNHRWTRVIDADTLESRYGLGQLTSAAMIDAAASQYKGYDGIWFDDIVLTGKSGSKRMNSWDFRNAFNLPSPGFTVRVVREISTPARFGFIGDSVGSSVASESTSTFRSVIDGSFASPMISAVSNRCTNRSSCSGTSGVDIAKGLPLGLDLVVVELGYNDSASTFASDVAAMMAALTSRGVKQVAWVNLAEIRTNSIKPQDFTYRPHNDALAAAARQWPNLTILDWNTASSDSGSRARWFSDGVHLTSTGQAEFALWLFDEATTLAPATRLGPPRKIVLPIHGAVLTGTAGNQVTVPNSATSVALNITAFQPVAPGFVTVWPCGSKRPETSNLNYVGGQIIANNVLAPIDDDGTVCLYSLVTTDVIIDVSGWFTAEASARAAATGVVGITPKRVVDTRLGLGWPGRVTKRNPIVIDVAGMTATRPDGTSVKAPSNVSAVSINVTSTESSGPGFLTVWPCDEPFPLASSVNYQAGSTVANGVFAGVDGTGQVCIYSLADTHVVVDVQGWVAPDQSAPAFTAVTPRRLVDTRSGSRVAATSSLKIPVRGAAVMIAGKAVKIPESATGVVVNVVAANPDRAGFVTVWPCAGDVPLASNLAYLGGDIRSNGVIAPIGPDGSICVYSHRPTDIIVDISGWLTGPTSGSGGFTGAVPKRFVDTRYAVGPAPV